MEVKLENEEDPETHTFCGFQVTHSLIDRGHHHFILFRG